MKHHDLSPKSPKPVGAKDVKMNAINEYRGKLDHQKERFPDIKIPQEFRTKYEMQMKMQPGTSLFAGDTINDEIRILYLQKKAV